VLEDVANIRRSTAPAQVNRKGPNRYVTLIANIHNKDLGSASAAVKIAIAQAGDPPRGVTVWTEGTMNLLDETMSSLLSGLAVALIAIFLMMAAYYQSFKVPLVILSVAPAVFAGSLLVLYLTGSTLNLQSYMGIIMAIGVSVSNTILLVDQGEFYCRKLFLLVKCIVDAREFRASGFCIPITPDSDDRCCNVRRNVAHGHRFRRRFRTSRTFGKSGNWRIDWFFDYDFIADSAFLCVGDGEV